MTTRSDPPPFQVPIRQQEKRHSLLPECSAAFAGLEITLKNMTTEVRGTRQEVRDMGKTQAAQAEAMKGLWHEMRDNIQPQLRLIPDKIHNDVDDHERDCPARRRAMKKAEGNGGTPSDIDVTRIRDSAGVIAVHGGGKLIRYTGNGHYEIPRPVLWIGALVGAAVAASGYVINLLQGMQ
jgi:hypothetical protein